MRSSVYINEVDPRTVTMDFSSSPSELVDKGSCYGFAFMKTLEHLGLEAEVMQPARFARLEVAGSVETIKARAPELQGHIGLIARYAAERARGWTSHEREWIGRMLGGFVQHTIPGFPETTSLMVAMGQLVSPFAETTNDDGVRVHYALQPSWRLEHDRVKDENGDPLGIFESRDVGGLRVGPDGLPAQEYARLTVKMTNTENRQLANLASAKGTRWGEELRSSLSEYLDTAPAETIQKTELGEDTMNIVTNISRVDLADVPGLFFEPGATIGDLLRTAVRTRLAEAAEDPELSQRMRQLQAEADKD